MNVDIFSLIITGGIGLLCVVIGVVLLTGRGAFLIAGYNTMPKKEREKYNEKALCRFVAIIILPVGILMPLLSIFGETLEWFPYVYAGIVLGMCVFGIIYANTGNRFKK